LAQAALVWGSLVLASRRIRAGSSLAMSENCGEEWGSETFATGAVPREQQPPASACGDPVAVAATTAGGSEHRGAASFVDAEALVGVWAYGEGANFYRIASTEGGLRYAEGNAAGVLRLSGEWLQAELSDDSGRPLGTVRLRRGGGGRQLESQFCPYGNQAWSSVAVAHPSTGAVVAAHRSRTLQPPQSLPPAPCAGGGRGLAGGEVEEEPPLSEERPGAERLPVIRFRNGEAIIVDRASDVKDLAGGHKFSRFQLPLRLSWAMTIHKSQGMTIDFLEVDLRNVFEAGQAYVALSRARTLEGLRVLSFDVRKIWSSPKVVEFYKQRVRPV